MTLRGAPYDPRQLTERGLAVLLTWVKRIPHDLPTAARAAGYLPQDVLSWYWGGHDPRCPHPLWAELAFEVQQIRARKAASNHRRVVRAAKGGVKRTETQKPDGTFERKVEEVLPAEWAIKALVDRLTRSAWATWPGKDVQDQLLELAEGLPKAPLEAEEAPVRALPPAVDDEPLE